MPLQDANGVNGGSARHEPGGRLDHNGMDLPNGVVPMVKPLSPASIPHRCSTVLRACRPWACRSWAGFVASVFMDFGCCIDDLCMHCFGLRMLF